MAKRGRKPKRLGVEGVPATEWVKPEHVRGDAEVAWNHFVALVKKAGNLDRTDPTLAEAYSSCFAMMRHAARSVELDGATFPNSRGTIVTNPACNVLNQAVMRLKAIIHDAGLCPAASKYAAEAAPSGDDDGGMAELLSINMHDVG